MKELFEHVKVDKILVFLKAWFYIKKVKLATLVEDDLKAPFSIAATPRRHRVPFFFFFFFFLYDLTWD